MLPDISLYNSFIPQTTIRYTDELITYYNTVVVMESRSKDPSSPFITTLSNWFLRLCGEAPAPAAPYHLFYKSKLVRTLGCTSLRFHRTLGINLMHADYSQHALCGNSSPCLLITAKEGADLILPTDNPNVYSFLGKQFIRFENILFLSEASMPNEYNITYSEHRVPPFPPSINTIVYTATDDEIELQQTKLTLLAAARFLGYSVATSSLVPRGICVSNKIVYTLFVPSLDPLEPFDDSSTLKYLRS